MKDMRYSVQKLSKMAGVSIRTLHIYDQIGLLKPSFRTEARYRLYGETELLRLQQILFYKELEFSLGEIKMILDKTDFDMLAALENHKTTLNQKQERIKTMIDTIEKTISNLKEGKMLNHEELYEGLPKEQANAYRQEAIEKWGQETVEKSEFQLKNMKKADFEILKNDFLLVVNQLVECSDEDPKTIKVQILVKYHYEKIAQFWGTKPTAEAYKGLGELYLFDKRYTTTNGVSNPKFAVFMQKAMTYFAENSL